MSVDRAANLHVPVPSRLRRAKQLTPAPLKASARAVTRTYGMATASQRTLPDFLILGTKRGGTTSLWNALVDHADVMPMFPASRQIKSPRYFDLHYDKGAAWYRSHFPTQRDREHRAARTGHRAVCGEANPYYMFHPLAPQRIEADLPAAKLIVSLRNPVDRAWSHYRERVGGGTEPLPFLEAIAAEADRLRGEQERIIAEAPHYTSYHHNYSSYLARGRYAEHLAGLLDRFGDRLLILRAEDYYSDEIGQLRLLTDFLGIRPYPQREVAHFNQMPRSSMPDEAREQLTQYYRPHVAALEQLLGRSMGWPGLSEGC